MDKKHEFIKDFISLCEKYGLAIECEDPYCGLEVVEYKEDIKEYYYNNENFWD